MAIADAFNSRTARLGVALTWTPDGGTTTYRWTKVTTTTAAGLWSPRVKSFGRLSKRLQDNGPIPYDITIDVLNTDGALDALVTTFTDTSANVIRADGELIIFNLDDVTETKTIAKLGFGSLIRAGDDGILTLHFTTRAEERYFGNIKQPTVSEIMAGLATADSANYGGYKIIDGMGDRLVPIAYGQFGPAADDSLEAEPAAILSSGLTCYLFGMSPFGYDLQSDTWKHIFLETEAGSNSFKSTKDPLGLFGLDIPVLYNENPTGVVGKCLVSRYVDAPGRVRAPALSFATSGTSVGSSPGFVTMLENVIDDYASDAGRWTTEYVDTASFVIAAKASGRVIARAYIPGKIGVWEWMRSVTHGVLETYFDNTGRLAVSNLTQEGAGYTYASALTVKGEWDCVDSAKTFWRIPETGERGGLANVYSVKTARPLNSNEKDTYGYEDSTSQSRHTKVTKPVEIGSEAIMGESSAQALALAYLDLTRDPFRVVRAMMTAKALQLDLGGLVLFSHPAVPGYATGRYCKVDGLEIDLDDLSVAVTMIDRHAILTRRVYIVNDESGYLVKDGTGFTFDATSGGAAFTVNTGGDFFTAGMVGDWLCIGGWPGAKRAGSVNNLWCKIAAVPGLQEITLETGGGEDGTLPDQTEVFISGASVRIYRDRSNYETSESSYVAQAEKYGAVCGTDGLFTDDVEQGFAMGEWT